MTMKGGSGSKTAAPTTGAAKNKGRLRSLKSSKSMSSVDRRGSDDSPDVDTGAKILQSQRKKILAVNAFEREKSKHAGKAAKSSKSQSRSGSREGRGAPKTAASKTAGKLMAAASKSTAMSSSASSTNNNTGTKNVTASGAKPRMFVRHNSTPAVIPLDKKGGTRKSALKSGVEAASGRPQRKKSASMENLPEAHKSAKSVRIDDVVEVRMMYA